MPSSRLAILILAVSLVAPLPACKIVPLKAGNAIETDGFDATALAEGLWTERVLPHVQSEAEPAATVLPAIAADLDAAGETFGYRPGEGSPWAFVVSGSGTVRAVNTESRAGTMEVELDGADSPLVVSLQIGPVIRGNAIRDALPFVSFQDFTNQLEYAEVGKALTAQAVEDFAATLEELEPGDRVDFHGALSLARSSDRVQVTPVILREVGR